MSAYDLALRWLIVSSAALLAWALIELAWELLAPNEDRETQ